MNWDPCDPDSDLNRGLRDIINGVSQYTPGWEIFEMDQSVNYHKPPRYYRKGRFVSWEIYHRETWFINFDIGRIEIQINRWGKDQD